MKRILSVLLTAFLLFSVISAPTAYAKAATRSLSGDESFDIDASDGNTAVSEPLIPDVVNFSDYRYVEGYDELALYLRDKMVQREDVIRVYMPYDETSYSKDEINGVTKKARSESISCGLRDGDYFVNNSISSIRWSSSVKKKDGKSFACIAFAHVYRSTVEMEDAVDEKLDELLPTLYGNTDYETIKNIHDFICENTTYDSDGYAIEGNTDHQRAYNALFEHKAVCGGYAALFYKMAKTAGFKTRVIRADDINHAWNAVELDGKWYYVDCTWDDIDDAKNSDNSTVTAQNTIYDYFMKGKSDFDKHGDTEKYTLGRDDGEVHELELADSKYSFTSGCKTHSYKKVATVNPSCGVNYCSVMRCAVCNEIKRTKVNSEAHTESEFAEIPASCTKTGISSCNYCTVCNMLLTDRTETEMTEHDCEITTVKPTCTENGYDIYKCKNCSYTDERNSVDPLDHDFGVNEKTCKRCGIENKNYVDPKPEPEPKEEIKTETEAKQAAVVPYVQTPEQISTVKLKKLKAGKKSFKVTWLKTEGAVRYEIQYSTKKSFKGAKSKIVANKTKLTVKKLKKGKKYYIRVRALTSNGVGVWSKTGKIKVK